MVEEFNNQLMELYKSMIEVCFEYTNFNEIEVDEIYILGTMHPVLGVNSADFALKINGKVTEVHKVNDHLTKKCDTSDDKQSQILGFLIDDLEKIYGIFEEFEQEKPFGLEIIYNVKEKKINASFSYESNDLHSYYVYQNWYQKISGQQISD